MAQGYTATYVDANTFTLVGDKTTEFSVNRRMKANCGSDGYKYGTIASTTYSSPNTTVVINTSGDDLTDKLVRAFYGEQSSGTTGTLPAHNHDGTEGTGGAVDLEAVGLAALTAKNPPINADLAIYRDSTDDDALVTSTWTQVKAFLKTYFDTLYNKYVHPNHSGDVTSTADGATVIAAGAVDLAMMANMATASIIARDTAGAGAPEVLSKADALTLLNVADGAQVNVATNLSLGTGNATTEVIECSTGTNVTLVEADTDNAGLLGADKWDEIVANTLKDTNVTSNLSEGASTETTVKVACSDGTDATMVSASTTRAGLLTKAKWDEIVANTLAKHTQGTDTALGTMAADINMNSLYQVVALQAPAANGEAIRQTATITEANLNTLTDDSMGDALHRHSELSASDGAPNPSMSVDANGLITLGYDLYCADKIVDQPVIRDYGETVNAIGSLGGGSDAIDLTSGNVVTATVDTGAQTFTFTNPPTSGTAGSFTLILTNGGSQTVNWPAAVDWAGGTEPTLTTSGIDILTFTTVDGGTIWYGFAAGLDMKSP